MTPKGDTPYIDRDLLLWLMSKFPIRITPLNADDREIGKRYGQQEVIDLLKRTYERQVGGRKNSPHVPRITAEAQIGTTSTAAPEGEGEGSAS